MQKRFGKVVPGREQQGWRHEGVRNHECARNDKPLGVVIKGSGGQGAAVV